MQQRAEAENFDGVGVETHLLADCTGRSMLTRSEWPAVYGSRASSDAGERAHGADVSLFGLGLRRADRLHHRVERGRERVDFERKARGPDRMFEVARRRHLRERLRERVDRPRDRLRQPHAGDCRERKGADRREE